MSAKAVVGIGAVLSMRTAIVTVIVAALALTLSTAAHAATITVDSLADIGSPGICVLRDAIIAANTMTRRHHCAAGTGNDTIQFSVTGMIPLASTLPTISDSLLTINGPTSPGITISGGGAVRVMAVAPGVTLNLHNVAVADGFAKGKHAGGIENDGGTLTVTDSTFANNSGYLGGGIENDGGTLTVSNSTFSGNSGFNGGGIYNAGTLTVSNSTFSANTNAEWGGGIYNAGTLTVTNSTFSANFANSGGILNEGTLTVTNSTFSANNGWVCGGIRNDGTATVINSTFSGNSGGDAGGFVNGGTATVINSTFSGNSTGEAGGILNGGIPGKLTVTNSTFSGNSGRFSGDIYNDDYFGGVTKLKSTILAATNGGSNCGGPIIDSGYNISDDTSCGFSASGSHNNTDPMLDPNGLQNNGGPTQTIALLSGSPAIDAIPVVDCTDQASPPNPIITDQRNFPRPDASEAVCDIGAFEVQDTPFVHFASFAGGLKIDPDASVFTLSGGFTLGAGGSIDPATQPVAFSVGSYAVRLPAGSFVKYKTGYVYQKKVNGVFLCLYLKFTDTPHKYVLLAYRNGTITDTASLVPVTLTIGDNSGSTAMNVRFD